MLPSVTFYLRRHSSGWVKVAQVTSSDNDQYSWQHRNVTMY